MSILDDWVNPVYLDAEYVEIIRESIRAKPTIKYCVLDNFFKVSMLERLIAAHVDLPFSEHLDKTTAAGELLPYDSSVVFARRGEHFGSELFFDEEWQQYCCYLTDTILDFPIDTDIKLRYHRPMSDGFWIHTDSSTRALVVIGYFNKYWGVADGGLLQLWRVDEEVSRTALCVESPRGRLDCLEAHRIQTGTPGGGFRDELTHDLVLIDQIVPSYNRIFMCNFQHNPAYHSITPSNGKPRTGFVQWMLQRQSRH